MREVRIVPVEGGYGFQILDDDVLWIDQPTMPGVEGNRPMTEAEAIAEADRIINQATMAVALAGKVATCTVTAGGPGWAGDVTFLVDGLDVGGLAATDRVAVLEVTLPAGRHVLRAECWYGANQAEVIVDA